MLGGASGHGLLITQGNSSTDPVDMSIGSTWNVHEWYQVHPSISDEGCNGGDFCGVYTDAVLTNIAPIPIPAAFWLFGSAIALAGVARRKRKL